MSDAGTSRFIMLPLLFTMGGNNKVQGMNISCPGRAALDQRQMRHGKRKRSREQEKRNKEQGERSRELGEWNGVSEKAGEWKNAVEGYCAAVLKRYDPRG